MEHLHIDFSKIYKPVTPMHAVNNGPVYKWRADQRITNIDAFREAKIPFIRNHDASFNATYGGEHTVDVHAIFPNFDADPCDPASYDFAMTDEYLRVIYLGGGEVYYRLGSKIEHGIKKYGTLPPPDFHKWAVICEHIIRHYNEGWADGFHYNIQYWEIWNEPDLDADDSDHKRNWGGTEKQFHELYNIALKHLKSCFPKLKIGGPAACASVNDWTERFLDALELKPDFYSWHLYANDPLKIAKAAHDVRDMMQRHGIGDAESILNEWNYVKGWEADEWIDSIDAMKGLKGASFTASTMCRCLYEDLDLLMYYDARPCAMNGLFDSDVVCRRLKGYWPFRMFRELYDLGNAVAVDNSNDHLHMAAATDGEKGAIMISYFDDDDSASAKDVTFTLSGLGEGKTAKLFLLDETHNMEEVQSIIAGGEIKLRMTLYSTYLITIE